MREYEELKYCEEELNSHQKKCTLLVVVLFISLTGIEYLFDTEVTNIGLGSIVVGVCYWMVYIQPLNIKISNLRNKINNK